MSRGVARRTQRPLINSSQFQHRCDDAPARNIPGILPHFLCLCAMCVAHDSLSLSTSYMGSFVLTATCLRISNTMIWHKRAFNGPKFKWIPNLYRLRRFYFRINTHFSIYFSSFWPFDGAYVSVWVSVTCVLFLLLVSHVFTSFTCGCCWFFSFANWFAWTSCKWWTRCRFVALISDIRYVLIPRNQRCFTSKTQSSSIIS